MLKLQTVSGISPDYINQVFSSANFSSESEQESVELINNKGNQAANLVNILKPEALEDNTALNEISEATNVDVDVLKDLAGTKSAAVEKADEEGLPEEKAEEMYFSLLESFMPEILSKGLQSRGVYAFFSDDEISEGTSNGDESTINAIKVIKYVDDSALNSEGSNEIADIISEATNGDKEVIQEVLELKEDAVEKTNFSNLAVFSKVVDEIAAQAGLEADASVANVLNTLRTKAEEMENRISSGEGVIKTEQQVQDPSETPLTNVDKFAPNSLPESVGSKIEADIKGSYTLTNTNNTSTPPNGSVETLFSMKNPNLPSNLTNNYSPLGLQGAPDTALVNRNYSSNDSEDVVSTILNISATNIRRNN